MKPSILLRVAAVFALLFCAGHMLGMPWTPATGPQQQALLQAMRSDHFQAMGASRTYWDFYFGFGLSIGVYLLVQAVVLWQLAALARTDAARLRPLIAAFLIAYAAIALLSWKYFFVAPEILAILVVLCLGAAFVSARVRSG